MRERGVDPRIDDASLDALTLSGDLSDEMWELIRSSAIYPAAISRAVESLELFGRDARALRAVSEVQSFYHKYPDSHERSCDASARVCAETFRRTMVRARPADTFRCRNECDRPTLIEQGRLSYNLSRRRPTPVHMKRIDMQELALRGLFSSPASSRGVARPEGQAQAVPGSCTRRPRWARSP